MGEQTGSCGLEVALGPVSQGTEEAKWVWVYLKGSEAESPKLHLLLEFPFGLNLMGLLSFFPYLWGSFHLES